MRRSQRRAVPGHRAAEATFRAGGSELDIHRAYLQATDHSDVDLPYGNIVALNEHGATLHYQFRDATAPARNRSLLLDAGATFAGYATDITRTWSDGDARFQALVDAVDAAQLKLVDQVRAGRDYRDLHLDAHRLLGAVLRDAGVLRIDGDSAVERGVTSTFFPHGLGHLLGLQVHDIGGFQASPSGGSLPRPEGHPFLRLTRTLEPGMVTTIEPGVYFIDTLLQKLRTGSNAEAVDWGVVEQLRPFGGVRIEDDVACTDGTPENLTRDAFAEA
jgi:Xaa-Pro dipeptidase